LMLGLPQRWIRNTDEIDWQRELAARQSHAGPVLVADRPGWEPRRRTLRQFWRIVGSPLTSVATGVTGVVLAGLQDHHVVLSAGTVVWGSVGVLIGSVVQALARRLLRRTELSPLVHAERGVPLIEILNDLWRYEQDFLKELPDLDEYEEWMSAATAQIGRYSPQVASEWATPDPAFSAQRDRVTAEAIRERIERTQTLHREVVNAGVSLEQLAAAGFPGAQAELGVRA
jgi:hypothetical protein